MSNIVVYSMAYRGDVYPYVPIASELSRRGHDVTFVCPREFHPDFASEPFRCVHSGTDFSPLTLDLPQHAEFVRRWGKRLRGGRLLKLYLGTLTIPYLDTLFDTLRTACLDADAQLIFGHPTAALVSSMVADDLGLPWVSGDLFPMLRPSASQPGPGMPDLGSVGNRAVWALATSRLLSPLTYERPIAAFRQSRGLPHGRRSPMTAGTSPLLNLSLASPHYVPLPADWTSNWHAVGFSLWAGPAGGILPDDVLAFLADGPPPVVVTLGTSGAASNPQVFERVVTLLNRTGERGAFLTSSETNAAKLSTVPGSARHGIWPFVPLNALLKQAKAIVHSGAHGTNSFALATGLPSVISPTIFDQVWHARRQEALGTGIYVKKPAHLEAALDRALHDESLAAAAQEFAARIAHEESATASADLIEGVLI